MSDNDRIADAIMAAFTSPNVSDSNLEPANLVDVMDAIQVRLRDLGNGTVSNPGAIEGHAMQLRDSTKLVSDSLSGIADALDRTEDQLDAHRVVAIDSYNAISGGLHAIAESNLLIADALNNIAKNLK